ncbi:MAG: class I SAM-dependent methyltransferase [Clostridia bacterium]|nr:class I SAM-dependent methyltransferase [Clostridia bacterium]
MFELLDAAKAFIEGSIKPDSVLCDFTMGNGHDTEYLCRKVPQGKVYAFDIQAGAVENTRARLEAAGITNAVLIHDSHSECEKYVAEEISAGMFNLGYLPGSGNKNIHTMRESTMPAVNSAIKLLKKGGVLVISVYPGHAEGKLEGEMLCEALSKLDKKYYCVTNLRLINSPDSPFIIAVEKYDK